MGLAGTAHRNGVILRREFPRLRALVERSREIYNARNDSHLKDSYNESLHVWRLLSGRMVEFAACQYEHDKENQRGRPRDFYGFDEVTEFTEGQYRFIAAWNRTVVPGQRCRVVAAGNPPSSVEGEWVIRYWAPWLDGQHAHPAAPGELRWFVRLDDKDVEVEGSQPVIHKGETITPRSRTFVPARLSDNPILAATGYGAVLQGLPEPLRSQMLYGDFRVGLLDDPWQVIPTDWVRQAQARWKPAGRNDWPLSCIGVDVARGGPAQTVISCRHRTWFAPLVKHPGRTTPDGPAAAALVLNAVASAVLPGQRASGAVVNVDVVGVGGSVYDALKGRANLNVHPINFGRATAKRDRGGGLEFANLRAYAYWSLREALDPVRGDGLALPPDRELLADLCSARWRPTARGVLIEAKEDVATRLGRSPDCGDAAVLAALQLDTASVGPTCLGGGVKF